MSNGKLEFVNSAQYWNERYNRNLSSGAGSYGKLAQFKADFLNAFVEKNGVKRVIEFGCGDGNQLTLASYPEYLGFDVATASVEKCSALFKDDSSKRFLPLEQYQNQTADLVLSLDVIYHLIEDEVFERHIENLFEASNKFVVIYASNDDSFNEGLAKHVKHRKFTELVEQKFSNNWLLLGVVPNKYPFNGTDHDNTSFSDFYIYVKAPVTHE